jgi:hypothetical protein
MHTVSSVVHVWVVVLWCCGVVLWLFVFQQLFRCITAQPPISDWLLFPSYQRNQEFRIALSKLNPERSAADVFVMVISPWDFNSHTHTTTHNNTVDYY